MLTGREAGRQLRLTEEAVIGRGSDATLRLNGDEVSRLHARIVRSPDGEHVLDDLSSKNGTWVNGERVASRALQAGDRIALGTDTVLLYTRRSPEEEDLIEGQKLDSLGRLAGGIAHEFNNLLSVILGNVQLVRQDPRLGIIGDPEVLACLDDAYAAADGARDLVRQLLGFARRGRWQDAPVDLAGLLEEARELLACSLDPRIALAVALERGLVVNGDRQQLFQMIMSLCLNARDALATGGELRLSLGWTEDGPIPALVGRGPHALIEVADTGPGMDSETRQRVFEPFFTTKQRGRGTGLGLAVAHGIVAGHGGQIWVESAPGLGARFRVALPLVTLPQVVARTDRAPTLDGKGEDAPTPGPAERRLVLLVDDDAMVRRSVARMLKRLGYQVEQAGGGRQGIERFESRKADLGLVLLDLVMPDLGGEEVLVRILATDPHARVLVMSGHHDEATAESLTAAGARGFLPKPFTQEALQVAIRLAFSG